MSRHRTPTAKAEISGATLKNPQRYRDRKPPVANGIGAPYVRMTEPQKAVWLDLARDLPWLNSSHRVLVRLACIWIAKIDEDGDIGVNATNSLSAILSKLGATPVDEAKLVSRNDDDEEPEDRFFH